MVQYVDKVTTCESLNMHVLFLLSACPKMIYIIPHGFHSRISNDTLLGFVTKKTQPG